MPKKAVKPFIKKDAGESFAVVHRSQQDPKYYDENSSKRVLLSMKAPKALPPGLGGSVVGSVSGSAYDGPEADDRSSLGTSVTGGGKSSHSRSSRVSRFSISSTTSSVLLRRVGAVRELAEVDAMGLPLDGYNYSAHLAETGGGMFVSASGAMRAGGTSVSGSSVASGRSSRTRRTGRGGGALDTLSEVDEGDAASGGVDETEALLEALMRGVDETRAAGARLGLPEDVLPGAFEDEVPRDLEAVSLRPDRMNPELRAALEDIEFNDEQGVDLDVLEAELEQEEDEEAEGEGAAGAARDGTGSVISSAGGRRTFFPKHGREGWEELEDDFMSQAMGKVNLAGAGEDEGEVDEEEEGSGTPAIGDAEGFDFDAHVARLMALAEGQMVDADDLDDQGGEEEEEDDEDEDEDGLSVSDGVMRFELDRRGGSTSRASDNLLQSMLSAYDDEHLGALDDADPRLRQSGWSAVASSGMSAGHVSAGRGSRECAPLPSARGVDEEAGLDEEDEEDEEEDEEDENDDEEGYSRARSARVLSRVNEQPDANGGYVYAEGEYEVEEEYEEEEEENGARPKQQEGNTLHNYMRSDRNTGAELDIRVKTSKQKSMPAGSANLVGLEDGHMGEDERRAGLAQGLTDPSGRAVKAVAFDHALAAWELEQDTRELESMQIAAKQARTRIRERDKSEREAARREAHARFLRSRQEGGEEGEVAQAEPSRPDAPLSSRQLAPPSPPGPATGPVPFGCADGDLGVDKLDFFPPDWSTARVKPKWDAETILSTHTASEHLPRRLPDTKDVMSLASRKGGKAPQQLDGIGSRSRAGGSRAGAGPVLSLGSDSLASSAFNPVPVRLSRRTGLPVGVILGPKGALIRENVAEEEAEEASESEVEGGYERAPAGPVPARRPEESSEEKRARKAAVKANQRLAREAKAAMKQVFKEEEKRVTGQLRAKDSPALGKGIVIRG